MKLTITAEDIRKGKRRSSTLCPIARALKRNKYQDITVYYDEIEFWRPFEEEDSIWIKPSRAVIKFMDSFDEGKKVKPCTFNLKEDA